MSDPAVVTASRQFICIRPCTYEDSDESALLRGFFAGRQDRLENTVFAVLDPEGREQILRGNRSPRMLFNDAAAFAARLEGIAGRFEQRPSARRPARELPLIANLRLAANVAACDSMPLVVIVGKDAKERDRLAGLLAPHAWSEAFVGRFHWVTMERKEAGAAEGFDLAPGVRVFQPDAFGQTARVLSKVGRRPDEKDLRALLEDALEAHDPSAKSRRAHVREGKRRGIHWESGTGESEAGATGERPAGRRGQ